MKKKYFLCLSAVVLVSFGIRAQDNRIYNPKETYQRSMRLETPSSRESVLKQFGKAYGLDAKNTFKLQSETSDFSGLSHQKHQQFYKGLKVEFGTVITHARNGNVEMVNGELYNPQNLNLTPKLSKEEAFAIAEKSVEAKKYLWEDFTASQAMDYQKPKGELLIFPLVKTAEVRLAYKYDIYAVEPISRMEIYVDAHSGEILYQNPVIKHANRIISNEEIKNNAKKVEEAVLGSLFATGTAATRYSGTRNIETSYDTSLSKHVLLDATRGDGIVTYNSNYAPSYNLIHFTDTDNVWNDGNYASTSSTKDNAALDAHWGAMKTYDFFKDIFNRNSYDDKGAQIKSFVHYDDSTTPPNRGYDNAFWNGSVMTYGDGYTVFKGPLTSVDVCGHEIGHAVCTYTANLAYQNQSGALNEGFSDIWGACIEQYAKFGNLNAPADTASPGTAAVWKIGEEITSAAYGGYLRSISYPKSASQPDTFLGANYITTADDGACTPTKANDWCGVHTNSGVLNHWFYIVTAGKSGTNDAPVPDTYNVTGIGMTKSSQIAYLAERDYLTPNATFMDARNAMIAVASALYCATSPEVKAVTDAWYAVNVGDAFTSPTIDVALKAISGGNADVSCNAVFSPTIVIENGGTSPLTAVTISYNVDGGANTTINWTGNLSNCSQVVQNIPVSGLTRGIHTLNVSTTSTSDANALNDSKSVVLVVNDNGTIGTVNTFETPADVLVAIDSNGKSNTVWERGAINKTKITAAVTGNSSGYATKLVGDYPNKTTSYLVSQCYNLATVSNPTVSFDMAFDLESNWDLMYFEYSTDSGATWKVLGTMNDPNWYNSSRLPDGDDCFNCIGKQWTGYYATAPTGGNGMNGEKRKYTHSLTELGAPSNAIFRFTFVSDDAEGGNGVFIDNFVIQGTLSQKENAFEKFAVYPNPSNGTFNVVLSSSDEVTIKVFDLRGRSVYNQVFADQGPIFNKEINLNALGAGVYILNVESDGKREAKRIIVE